MLDEDVGPLGWFGTGDLALPDLDLPVSSVAWTLWLPEVYTWGTPAGEALSQRFAGSVTWFEPDATGNDRDAIAGEWGPSTGAGSTRSGAMPVRIDVPTQGERRTWARYWLGAGEPATVSLDFHHRRLRAPALLAGLGLTGLFPGLAVWARRRWVWAVATGIIVVGGSVMGTGAAVFATTAGLAAGAYGSRQRLVPALAAWLGQLRTRWRALEAVPWPTPNVASLTARALALAGVLFLISVAGLGVLLRG